MGSDEVPIVRSLQIGSAAPLGPDGVLSGIVKNPVNEAVSVKLLGFVGDAQADLSVHGGPEKAVYGYAATRYPAWIADFPDHAASLTPGAFGENLTIGGMDEDSICVGDIHAIGTARLQVCQPRQPCFKLALRFADDRLPRAMIRNGRSGWYYRVVEEGQIAPGDPITVAERDAAAFPLGRLTQIVYHRNGTAEEMAMLAEIEGTASWIRDWAKRRLDRDASAKR